MQENNYYNKIKDILTENELYKKVKEYSKKLSKELGKGYSIKNLKRMRQFYLFKKRSTVSTQLTWRHYVELLSFDDINKINYYINICEYQNLSVRELRQRIKSKEYLTI